jgi:hypothetical protein
MHSQVSESNLTFFISEGRVDDHIDEDDLRTRFDRTDGTLIACNSCGTLREVTP